MSTTSASGRCGPSGKRLTAADETAPARTLARPPRVSGGQQAQRLPGDLGLFVGEKTQILACSHDRNLVRSHSGQGQYAGCQDHRRLAPPGPAAQRGPRCQYAGQHGDQTRATGGTTDRVAAARRDWTALLRPPPPDPALRSPTWGRVSAHFLDRRAVAATGGLPAPPARASARPAPGRSPDVPAPGRPWPRRTGQRRRR